jgi:hypothetical protein
MSEDLRSILTLIGILPIDRPNKTVRAGSLTVFSLEERLKHKKDTEELFKLFKDDRT